MGRFAAFAGLFFGIFLGLQGGLLVIPPHGALAAELRVDVTGLRSAEGQVHFALYDSAEAFPDSDGMLREKVVAITGGKVRAVFSQLPLGTYAIAVFHDENRNREFDQGWFGIPLEGFAFSNDAKVAFGPPEFSAAAVPVDGEEKNITIRMTYW